MHDLVSALQMYGKYLIPVSVNNCKPRFKTCMHLEKVRSMNISSTYIHQLSFSFINSMFYSKTSVVEVLVDYNQITTELNLP